VHELSGRSGELRALDCGAIPETLFESKLFGHRRGAFTGATEHRTGEIVAARGGTLFLDELGNLPAASQAKLLRAIEAGEVTPIGSGVVEPVDVRWIAATNRDLLNDPGDFRPDLLRRLAGYVGRLPPLRQRREDLGVLTAYFLQQAGVRKASISVPAARRLFLAPLLGNLRQLRTALRASSTLAGDQPIELYHLPPLDEPQRKTPPRSVSSGTGSSGSTAQLTRSMETPPREDSVVSKSGRRPTPESIREALRSTGGIVVQAAQRLGTQPRSLYRWLERYQISLSEFRDADDPKDAPEPPEPPDAKEPKDPRESKDAKEPPDPGAAVASVVASAPADEPPHPPGRDAKEPAGS
jgi:transcriptional regulator with GAF, ATPase, and Fis domain